MKPLLLLARQDLRAIRWWLLLALVAGVMVQTHSELWNPLNPFESWTLPVSYVVCGLAWFFMAGTIAFQHPAADPRAAWRLRPVAPWMVVVETPHHGLTGADGKLSLATVPAGAYRLRAWADKAGTQRA